MSNETVSLTEFNERLMKRAATNEAFARNTAMLARSYGDWRKWPLHLQKDVFQKLHVGAVLMPLGPGGEVVPSAGVKGPGHG